MGTTDARALARTGAVWRRIEQARLLARSAQDDATFAASGRDDVEALGRVLAEILFAHEPRDGSAWCPVCELGGSRRAWPCGVWAVAVDVLVPSGGGR